MIYSSIEDGGIEFGKKFTKDSDFPGIEAQPEPAPDFTGCLLGKVQFGVNSGTPRDCLAESCSAELDKATGRVIKVDSSCPRGQGQIKEYL